MTRINAFKTQLKEHFYKTCSANSHIIHVLGVEYVLDTIQLINFNGFQRIKKDKHCKLLDHLSDFVAFQF